MSAIQHPIEFFGAFLLALQAILTESWWAGVLVSRETPVDVLASAAKSTASIARMKHMTMYEIFCGKHLEDDGESPAQPAPPVFTPKQEPQAV